MYKTSHNDFAKFYEAAQKNKGGKQSHYAHTTKSGVELQIPSDTIWHDKKHPDMTATQWEKGPADIDNIAAITITSPRFLPGVGVLAKVNRENSIYWTENNSFPQREYTVKYVLQIYGYRRGRVDEKRERQNVCTSQTGSSPGNRGRYFRSFSYRAPL